MGIISNMKYEAAINRDIEYEATCKSATINRDVELYLRFELESEKIDFATSIYVKLAANKSAQLLGEVVKKGGVRDVEAGLKMIAECESIKLLLLQMSDDNLSFDRWRLKKLELLDIAEDTRSILSDNLIKESFLNICRCLWAGFCFFLLWVFVMKEMDLRWMVSLSLPISSMWKACDDLVKRKWLAPLEASNQTAALVARTAKLLDSIINNYIIKLHRSKLQ